jgi:hypothetical protein
MLLLLRLNLDGERQAVDLTDGRSWPTRKIKDYDEEIIMMVIKSFLENKRNES